MWSVWSDDIELYLGQGLALLKTRHAPLQVLRHSPTLPLQSVLAQLAPANPERPKGWRFRRPAIRVSLSAALCPALSYSPPAEVKRWHELRQIALASAAAQLGTSGDQLRCEIDTRHRGLTACVAQPLMDELQRWAQSHHGRLLSVQPLWVVALQCRRMRQAGVQGLWVQEPDASTLIAQQSSGQLVVTTLTGAPEQESAATPAFVRRWLLSHGLSQLELSRLNFGAEICSGIAQGPRRWAQHWSAP